MEKEKSYFDGRLIQRIGWRLLAVLITMVTFGICLPFGIVWLEKWEVKHTVIEGKRLVFDGNAIQLFGNWIKWLLLIIITLGIYSFWVDIKMKQWITKHTIFAE